MKKSLDYPMMVDEAMRGVVREALKQIKDEGISGNHHFYISFNTRFAGVSISPQLLEKYPQQITIVIQHQFWDLEIYKHSFTVALSFNNVPEKLIVPFNALTAFADPSVRFGLQFNQISDAGDEPPTEEITEAMQIDDANNATSTSKVISLDAFRKNS